MSEAGSGGFFTSFRVGDSDWTIIVEDDGDVAYAFLHDGRGIVSDVWLFNRAEAPAAPPWVSATGPPEGAGFLNPAGLVDVDAPPAPALDEETRFSAVAHWDPSGETLLHVDLHIDDAWAARLAPGVKPGWSRQAAADGPLARTWEGAP